MIREIIFGDITDPALHQGDIIIGMNTTLGEASVIGRPFAKDIGVLNQIDRGSVLTFEFDAERKLHMLVCHRLGRGGWADAEKYVRYSLDYLWQKYGERQFGIVQIGHGPVGQRDGAIVPDIRTAMANSFLEMDLFILPEEQEARVAVAQRPLKPLFVWDMGRGEREIRVH